MCTLKLGLSKVSNIKFDGIDPLDHPDYCDAYIVNADYEDREMTEDELYELNDERDFIHEQLFKQMH